MYDSISLSVGDSRSGVAWHGPLKRIFNTSGVITKLSTLQILSLVEVNGSECPYKRPPRGRPRTAPRREQQSEVFKRPPRGKPSTAPRREQHSEGGCFKSIMFYRWGRFAGGKPAQAGRGSPPTQERLLEVNLTHRREGFEA